MCGASEPYDFFSTKTPTHHLRKTYCSRALQNDALEDPLHPLLYTEKPLTVFSPTATSPSSSLKRATTHPCLTAHSTQKSSCIEASLFFTPTSGHPAKETDAPLIPYNCTVVPLGAPFRDVRHTSISENPKHSFVHRSQSADASGKNYRGTSNFMETSTQNNEAGVNPRVQSRSLIDFSTFPRAVPEPVETTSLTETLKETDSSSEPDEIVSPSISAGIDSEDDLGLPRVIGGGYCSRENESSHTVQSLCNAILSVFVVPYLRLQDIGRVALTCQAAFLLAKRERWLKRAVWLSGVPARLRPRFWMDVCAFTRILQGLVARKLYSMNNQPNIEEKPFAFGMENQVVFHQSFSAYRQQWLETRNLRLEKHNAFLGGCAVLSIYPHLQSNTQVLESQDGVWYRIIREEHGSHDDTELGSIIFSYLVTPTAVSLTTTKCEEIERDVSRTFPQHLLFCDRGGIGQQWIFDILKALACIEPNVGYCQGMNFVVAGLLSHLHCPIAAFWMTLAILYHYHYKHIFSPSVPQVALRLYQFNELARYHLRPLHDHLHSHGLSTDFFFHQWLMSAFAYFVHLELSAVIWDAFFISGWKALFKIGLALLLRIQSRILSANNDTILQVVQAARRAFFKQAEGQAFYTAKQTACKKLLRRAQGFKVRTRDLEDLASQFLRFKLQVFLRQMPITDIKPSHLSKLLYIRSVNLSKESECDNFNREALRQSSHISDSIKSLDAQATNKPPDLSSLSKRGKLDENWVGDTIIQCSASCPAANHPVELSLAAETTTNLPSRLPTTRKYSSRDHCNDAIVRGAALTKHDNMPDTIINSQRTRKLTSTANSASLSTEENSIFNKLDTGSVCHKNSFLECHKAIPTQEQLGESLRGIVLLPDITSVEATLERLLPFFASLETPGLSKKRISPGDDLSTSFSRSSSEPSKTQRYIFTARDKDDGTKGSSSGTLLHSFWSKHLQSLLSKLKGEDAEVQRKPQSTRLPETSSTFTPVSFQVVQQDALRMTERPYQFSPMTLYATPSESLLFDWDANTAPSSAKQSDTALNEPFECPSSTNFQSIVLSRALTFLSTRANIAGNRPLEGFEDVWNILAKRDSDHALRFSSLSSYPGCKPHQHFSFSESAPPFRSSSNGNTGSTRISQKQADVTLFQRYPGCLHDVTEQQTHQDVAAQEDTTYVHRTTQECPTPINLASSILASSGSFARPDSFTVVPQHLAADPFANLLMTSFTFEAQRHTLLTGTTNSSLSDNLSLKFVAMGYPDVIPAAWIFGYRFKNAKLNLDNLYSKRITRTIQRNSVYDFSLGLWVLCSLRRDGKCASSSGNSQRFFDDLPLLFTEDQGKNFYARTDDYQQTSSSDTVRLWCPAKTPNEGCLATFLETLVRARGDIDALDQLTARKAKQMQLYLSILEKEIRILTKETKDAYVQFEIDRRWRGHALKEKIKQVTLLQQSVYRTLSKSRASSERSPRPTIPHHNVVSEPAKSVPNNSEEKELVLPQSPLSRSKPPREDTAVQTTFRLDNAETPTPILSVSRPTAFMSTSSRITSWLYTYFTAHANRTLQETSSDDISLVKTTCSKDTGFSTLSSESLFVRTRPLHCRAPPSRRFSVPPASLPTYPYRRRHSWPSMQEFSSTPSVRRRHSFTGDSCRQRDSFMFASAVRHELPKPSSKSMSNLWNKIVQWRSLSFTQDAISSPGFVAAQLERVTNAERSYDKANVKFTNACAEYKKKKKQLDNRRKWKHILTTTFDRFLISQLENADRICQKVIEKDSLWCPPVPWHLPNPSRPSSKPSWNCIESPCNPAPTELHSTACIAPFGYREPSLDCEEDWSKSVQYPLLIRELAAYIHN